MSAARRIVTLGLSRRALARQSAPTMGVWDLSLRWYRGESGEMEKRRSPDEAVAQREEALLQVAQPRSEKILARHVKFPSLDDIPSESHGLVETEENKKELELEVRKKRLIYRAKQRGWLEVDLLLGTWANQNVPNLLTMDELNEFEAFVNLETIDIYNIITLRSDVPDEMKTADGNGIVERIQEWARASPLGKASPDQYKSVKTENNLI
eukprot:scaffold66991_cov39-Attheya_sp.AAC.1